MYALYKVNVYTWETRHGTLPQACEIELWADAITNEIFK